MNYQINAYYANFFPGKASQYDNLIWISVVELTAYILTGFIFERLGNRAAAKLFVFAFSICLVGATGIIVSDAE